MDNDNDDIDGDIVRLSAMERQITAIQRAGRSTAIIAAPTDDMAQGIPRNEFEEQLNIACQRRRHQQLHPSPPQPNRSHRHQRGRNRGTDHRYAPYRRRHDTDEEDTDDGSVPMNTNQLAHLTDPDMEDTDTGSNGSHETNSFASNDEVMSEGSNYVVRVDPAIQPTGCYLCTLKGPAAERLKGNLQVGVDAGMSLQSITVAVQEYEKMRHYNPTLQVSVFVFVFTLNQMLNCE